VAATQRYVEQKFGQLEYSGAVEDDYRRGSESALRYLADLAARHAARPEPEEAFSGLADSIVHYQKSLGQALEVSQVILRESPDLSRTDQLARASRALAHLASEVANTCRLVTNLVSQPAVPQELRPQLQQPVEMIQESQTQLNVFQQQVGRVLDITRRLSSGTEAVGTPEQQEQPKRAAELLQNVWTRVGAYLQNQGNALGKAVDQIASRVITLAAGGSLTTGGSPPSKEA
jgi:hypothetical protein